MSVCPRCNQRLIRTASVAGLLFRCPRCDGRAVGLSVLRRVIPQRCARELWMKARQENAARGKRCPICQRRMREVPVPADGGEVALDVCTSCQFVWFDPQEFEQFPQQPAEQPGRKQLPLRAREAVALAELRLDQERRRGADFGEEPPDEAWKWIPAILGMPVEQEVNPLRHWPWVTWALAAVMVLTFVFTFRELLPVVTQYGLVPAEMWRHSGVTFITSFFLHGGLLHLLGNVYFLLVFGDNTEDQLGPWRYLLLIGAAAFVGDLLHVATDPHDMTPCIGASGGISGVIAFYALKFPHARLGFMFRYWFVFRWFYLPAWFALIAWCFLQLLLAHLQLAKLSDISAVAHLGGAGVGVLAWLLWREVGTAFGAADGQKDAFAAMRRDPGDRP